jgi:hypothetical protein
MVGPSNFSSWKSYLSQVKIFNNIIKNKRPAGIKVIILFLLLTPNNIKIPSY